MKTVIQPVDSECLTSMPSTPVARPQSAQSTIPQIDISHTAPSYNGHGVQDFPDSIPVKNGLGIVRPASTSLLLNGGSSMPSLGQPSHASSPFAGSAAVVSATGKVGTSFPPTLTTFPSSVAEWERELAYIERWFLSLPQKDGVQAFHSLVRRLPSWWMPSSHGGPSSTLHTSTHAPLSQMASPAPSSASFPTGILGSESVESSKSLFPRPPRSGTLEESRDLGAIGEGRRIGARAPNSPWLGYRYPRAPSPPLSSQRKNQHSMF
jgi:hypothetical protein